MPKPTKGPRLGGSPAHERIILANLASQLFEHGKITTTEAKAKRVQPLAEKLISKAKRGDLHARRLVLSTIADKGVVHTLFTEIAPSLEGREGGYTRITKIGPRKGDNAPMAVIEIVTESVEDGRKARAARKGAAAAPAPAKKTAAKKSAAPAAAEVKADADEKINEVEVAPTTLAEDPAPADAPDYGPDSYVGDNPPAGYTVKGNADSKKFHVEASPWYESTNAEVWFKDGVAAKAAGFEDALEGKPVDGMYVGNDEVPETYTIKGNADSMLFHGPDSQWYDQTKAEVWFRDADAAKRAGYRDAMEGK